METRRDVNHRYGCRAQVRVDAWRGGGMLIALHVIGTRLGGAHIERFRRSKRPAGKRRPQHAPPRRSSRLRPGCWCQQPKPPRARRPHPRADGPADTPAGPRRRGHAWRGRGRPGTRRGLRPRRSTTAARCCGSLMQSAACLRAERKFFCWSLPGHLPLRPDAPDAQNALSGKMVTKSRLSGKMVIPRWGCPC